MRPQDVDLIIHHADCWDGIAAAWAVRQAAPNAEVFAARYGDTPPDVTGRKVAVVDFSYPRDVLLSMRDCACDLIVLDHHKTAAAALEGLDFARFHMSKSGCRMAWEWAQPALPLPKLLEHIEDRDLWRFVEADTRAICACLRTFPMTIDVVDLYATHSGAYRLREYGSIVLRYEAQLVARHVSRAVRSVLHVGDRDEDVVTVEVLAVNASTHQSEIGEALYTKHPELPIALYFAVDDGWVVSLRSAEGGPDVSELAKANGGGGHRHAAGFKYAGAIEEVLWVEGDVP